MEYLGKCSNPKGTFTESMVCLSSCLFLIIKPCVCGGMLGKKWFENGQFKKGKKTQCLIKQKVHENVYKFCLLCEGLSPTQEISKEM